MCLSRERNGKNFFLSAYDMRKRLPVKEKKFLHKTLKQKTPTQQFLLMFLDWIVVFSFFFVVERQNKTKEVELQNICYTWLHTQRIYLLYRFCTYWQNQIILFVLVCIIAFCNKYNIQFLYDKRKNENSSCICKIFQQQPDRTVY